MIARSLAPALIAFALAGAAQAADTPKAKPAPCPAALKAAEDGKALAEVKLAEEYERSDAQVYLMRLELSITKRELAAALAKCGAACNPAKP